eukprot:scaffold658188_cov50-Prasinocladus_malaysianus.AAC.1
MFNALASWTKHQRMIGLVNAGHNLAYIKASVRLLTAGAEDLLSPYSETAFDANDAPGGKRIIICTLT